MQKILFISSGNSKDGVSPIVMNQGKSLEKLGMDVQYYQLKGKGFSGYIRNIIPLRNYLRLNQFDIIHTHFSLTAFITSLASAKPLVVSLMGWNVKLWYYKWLILFFNWVNWRAVIVKSVSMKRDLGIKKNIFVIPNGIDLERFKPLDKIKSLEVTGWKKHKNILFAANPDRPIKRYALALAAFQSLKLKDTAVHTLNSIPNELMPYYYNACDLVLLTSRAEGSPNVIKEAMACNCPIVTTDVGDVQSIIGNTEGCFISGHDPSDIAENIQKALAFNAKTNGRQRVLNLDEKIVAQKIIAIYQSVLNK